MIDSWTIGQLDSWTVGSWTISVGQLDSWQMDRFEKYYKMIGYILAKNVINHQNNYYGGELQRFGSVPKSLQFGFDNLQII
jgi:hypothetical protein